MDSTQIMSNIKRAGRLALAYDVLLKGIKACPTELLTASLKRLLEPGYKNTMLYKLKNDESPTRLQMLLNLCFELSQIVKDNEKLNNDPAIRLMERFLKEQAIFNEEQNTWLAKENKDIAASSLQSAHDTQATYRKKAGKGHTGFVTNIAETCSEDNAVQVVTSFQVEPNITSDVEMAKNLLPDLVTKTGLNEMYTDGGYYGEDTVKQAEKLEIKIHFTDMTGRKTSLTKLPYHAFSIKNFQEVLTLP